MTLLAWRRGGTAGGATVVLVHDWAADGGTWEAHGWVDRLGQAGLDLVVCDLPGHGGSADVTPPATAEPAAWAASAILADLTKLGVDRCAVAGHAAGCLVAAQLAVRAPTLVTRLVLIATADSPHVAHAAEVAAGLRDPTACVWNPDAAEQVSRARWDRRHDLAALADFVEHAAWPAAARLGALRTPTLLAVGANSARRERAPRLARLFHDAHLVTAPGDDATVLGAPELIATVADFLR